MFRPAAVLIFVILRSAFGRGLKLPNRGVALEKNRRTSIAARVPPMSTQEACKAWQGGGRLIVSDAPLLTIPIQWCAHLKAIRFLRSWQR